MRGNCSVITHDSLHIISHAKVFVVLLIAAAEICMLAYVVPRELSQMRFTMAPQSIAKSAAKPQSTRPVGQSRISSKPSKKPQTLMAPTHSVTAEIPFNCLPLVGLFVSVAVAGLIWRSKIVCMLNASPVERAQDPVGITEDEMMYLDTQNKQLQAAQLLVAAGLVSANYLEQAYAVSRTRHEFLNDCLISFNWASKGLLEIAMVMQIQIEGGLLDANEASKILRDAKRNEDALAAELLLERTRPSTSLTNLTALPVNIHSLLDDMFESEAVSPSRHNDQSSSAIETTVAMKEANQQEFPSSPDVVVETKILSAHRPGLLRKRGWLQLKADAPSAAIEETNQPGNAAMLLAVVEELDSKLREEQLQSSEVKFITRTNEQHEFVSPEQAQRLCDAWLLALAQQPNTPATVLRRLAQTNNKTIRTAVAKNAAAPLELIWLDDKENANQPQLKANNARMLLTV